VRAALATTRQAPEQHALKTPAVARGPAAILALQRSAGNAAVVALLQREPVAEAEAKPGQPDLDPAPGWRAEVELPSSESAEALLTYLDGIMARESAAALEERLEGAVSVDPYSSEGFSAAKP